MRITRFTAAAVAVAAMAPMAAAPMLLAHEGEHHEEMVQAPAGMKITAIATRQAPGGLLVRPITRGFRFAPKEVSPIHGKGRLVSGRGHAHLFVDGEMATMLVGPWTYVAMKSGKRTLRVTLNANSHLMYAHGEHPVQLTTRRTVAKAAM
jgi:hypothetical protein